MDTLSACENACRDFQWIGPLLPALVAASIALLIAFVAYPWQKRKDREQQIHSEARRVYAGVLSQFNTYFAEIYQGEKALSEKSFYKLTDELMILQIYASEGVLRKARSFLDRLIEFRGIKFDAKEEEENLEEWSKKREVALKSAKEARNALIIAMRADLFGGSLNSAATLVTSFNPSPEVEPKK